MRTEKSLRNVKYSIIGQVVTLFASFIQRTIFIKFLSQDLLGINSLFTNILSILSLAELGVGTSITYYLYKPIYEKDETKITQIMNFFKKIYIIIGWVIFCLGMLIIPFLSLFIDNIKDYDNIYLIYILFVLNTSISYFFSYDRTLIIANQDKYIDALYRYVGYVLLYITQAIVIIVSKNYILFLILQIIFTIVENYLISRKARKDYPYINNKKLQLEKNEKKEIFKNAKAMMLHKIGWVVVSSTDNLLISKFINITLVGIYSNYNMIISALTTVITQIYNAITASIGNLCASKEDNNKQENIFLKIDFFTYFIYAISTSCLIALFNPFIKLWIGEKYLLSISTVIIISISFYINGMRKSVLAFRDSMGLFYVDRYKSLIEAFLNIVLSIVFAMKFGIDGIFMGTILSSLLSSSWIEPLVLYKYGFRMKVKNYYKRFIVRFIYLFVIIIINYYLVTAISINSEIFEFCIKVICSLIVTTTLMIIYSIKNESFKYFVNLFKQKIEGIFYGKKKV
ncbi:MAG: oligosaccharide flippase family protein [Clostridia bacterium]|nr:oligosaccharide flippase family protein [Clostridia bacterium]